MARSGVNLSVSLELCMTGGVAWINHDFSECPDGANCLFFFFFFGPCFSLSLSD